MKTIFLLKFFLLSFIFPQFDLDARMIGVSGAYTTMARGYHCIGINPANLAANKELTLNLFSANAFLVNDFLSVELYNEINGANLEDPTQSNFYSKDDILNQVKGNDITLEAGWTLPIPSLNFAKKNFGISMVQKSYFRFDMPKDVLSMLLKGNTTEKLIFEFGSESISTNEIGLSYARSITILDQTVYFGATLKYLQGLLYLKTDDIQEDGSFFQTDEDYFSGSGRYLVRQAFGGGGSAIDIGVLIPDIADNGWTLGLSLINLGGSIKWGDDNMTRKMISSYENQLPLRKNEFYYFDYEIEPVNGMDIIDQDGEETSFNSSTSKVAMYSDIPLCSEVDLNSLICLNSNEVGELIPTSNTNLFSTNDIVDLGDGSYLIPSENLDSSFLQNQSSEDINLDYPSFLRIGASKVIENIGTFSIDAVTGFDDSFGNSSKFRLAMGAEIIRINKNIPLRFGCSLGGRQPNSFSLGFGLKLGAIFFDFGRKYYHGLIMNKAKGVEYAINISLDFNRGSFKNFLKFNLPKMKLPKLPKMPD